MHSEYVKDTDNFERRAARVVEEMAEVIAAYAKAKRFGWKSYNPELGPESEKNWEWFFRELQDAENALDDLFEFSANEIFAGRSPVP